MQDVNDYMDAVLEGGVQKYPEVDPMGLRGRYAMLNSWIRSDWTANIKDVALVGLSQVRRAGDCAEASALPSGRLVVSCSLRLDALSVRFTSAQSYLGQRPDVIGVTATFPPHLASLTAEVGARRYPVVTLKLHKKLDPTISYTNLGNLTENETMRLGYGWEASDMLHRALQKEYVDHLADALADVPAPY